MTNPEIDAAGTKRWYNDKGQLHREDGPAIIYTNGAESWYQNDEHHRTDGPAIIYLSGTEYWYRRNKLHRTDGPAIIYLSGTEYWYRRNKLHRTNGPAIIHLDEELWFVNDIRINIQPILERLDISPDWKSWTDVEKMIVRLAL